MDARTEFTVSANTGMPLMLTMMSPTCTRNITMIIHQNTCCRLPICDRLNKLQERTLQCPQGHSTTKLLNKKTTGLLHLLYKLIVLYFVHLGLSHIITAQLVPKPGCFLITYLKCRNSCSSIQRSAGLLKPLAYRRKPSSYFLRMRMRYEC